MGAWSYAYDGFGELVSQTDAKNQTTSLSYDVLGRLIQSSDPTQTDSFTYGTSAADHNIGQLASASTNGGYNLSNSFDAYGRPVGATLTIAGTNYPYAATYNGDGRLASLSYPSGLVLDDAYTASGDLSQVKDNGSGLAYWTANSADAELQVTSETFGNGATETQSFDPATGRLTGVTAGSNNGIANWQYSWDGVGNLLSRTDSVEGYTEYFCYDPLNRLTEYAIGASCSASGATSIGYDALGDITSKSDVGTYTIPLPARPIPMPSLPSPVR